MFADGQDQEALVCLTSGFTKPQAHCQFGDVQEQEALLKELTEVLQRQKTRVAALQKDRAGMVSQLAAYQPAEQDKLRAEMGTLRERVGELAGIKVGGKQRNALLDCAVRLFLLTEA